MDSDIQATTSNAVIVQEEETNSYDSVFPSLPVTIGNTNQATSWPHESGVNKLQVKRQTITQVFQIPVEERRDAQAFGNETNHRCETVAQRYGVKVEICCSKDQSLHIVISGNEDKVLEAKRAIISEIQTEKEFKYKVPKELHKFIIGRNGETLKDLQEKTCTNIQIPKSDLNSDIIIIHGPKDGIDRAVHEIQSICDEKSKTGYERLNIPKSYHPWIRGPHGEIVNNIMASTGAKINLPPIDLDKDEITITGDKEKVELARIQVMKIFEEKKHVGIKKVEFQITKTQHKFIIGKSGQTVQDIFKDHDVYVMVPRADQNSETITLFGEESKIGGAMTQVYAKANSIITIQIAAPTWLHRYIIGDQYSTITKITADYPGTHVKFEADNKITLEGPPDEIEKLKDRLNNILKELQQNLTYSEVSISPKFYGHVIGKNHENVTRMKSEYGVQVRLTPENSDQSSIRIEGSEEGVQKAKVEIEELLKRLENERSKDIIIDQKYHSNLIGQGGKNIAEVRSKFNGVNISIPNADKKSDIITVRGNKAEVERCCKYLQQVAKEYEESNYREEIHIFKNFHKMIIGKQGGVIRKIKEATNTRIDVPADSSESDTVQITGKREKVIEARKMLEDKVKELIKIEEDFVEIPHSLHNALIGRGGAIIKQVRKDCGNLIISFPPENKPSDKIVLRGPREDIDKAKEELLRLYKHRNEISYSEDVSAKLEYHRYLVGRKGNNINQLRDKYNVRIVFPQSDGNNNNTNGDAAVAVGGSGDAAAVDVVNANDVITIMGKEENVKKCRVEVEAIIKNLEEQVTEEVQVDSKWHKSFIARRGRLINKISRENCNVNISFPKTGNAVAVKGPREAVDAAKKKILEIVYEFENQVTIEVVIPQKYHVAVIGTKGGNSQEISENFNVELIFPAKAQSQQNDEGSLAPVANGFESVENVVVDGIEQQQNGDAASKFDVVLISGLLENCEKAKEALLKLVPINENFDFPNEYHKYLLTNKAEFLREVNTQHNVQVVVPRKGDDSNYITLVGLKIKIDDAKEMLQGKLEEYEAERKYRELKNFTLEFEIKPEYIQLLRGKMGAEAKKLGEKYDVNVNFSRKGEPIDKVIIRGYEAKALEAKEEILRRVNEYDSKISEEIHVDVRVHSRIIGGQGKNLKKITDKYKVDIKFPGRSSESNDLIIVSGDTIESIDDCIDYLKNLEEEYLQDVNDRDAYQHPSRQQEKGEKPVQNTKGFVVKGAPWERNSNQAQVQVPVQVPDTTNLDDFPTISSVGAETRSAKASWGPSRR
jgi:hypothetical protein